MTSLSDMLGFTTPWDVFFTGLTKFVAPTKFGSSTDIVESLIPWMAQLPIN